jgi:hypothetical protein
MRFEEWVNKLRDPVKKKAGEAIIEHNTKGLGDSHNGKCYIDLNSNTESVIKVTKYHYAVEEYEVEMYRNNKDMIDYPLMSGRFTSIPWNRNE